MTSAARQTWRATIRDVIRGMREEWSAPAAGGAAEAPTPTPVAGTVAIRWKAGSTLVVMSASDLLDDAARGRPFAVFNHPARRGWWYATAKGDPGPLEVPPAVAARLALTPHARRPPVPLPGRFLVDADAWQALDVALRAELRRTATWLKLPGCDFGTELLAGAAADVVRAFVRSRGLADVVREFDDVRDDG